MFGRRRSGTPATRKKEEEKKKKMETTQRDVTGRNVPTESDAKAVIASGGEEYDGNRGKKGFSVETNRRVALMSD